LNLRSFFHIGTTFNFIIAQRPPKFEVTHRTQTQHVAKKKLFLAASFSSPSVYILFYFFVRSLQQEKGWNGAWIPKAKGVGGDADSAFMYYRST